MIQLLSVDTGQHQWAAHPGQPCDKNKQPSFYNIQFLNYDGCYIWLLYALCIFAYVILK